MKHPNRDEWVPFIFGEASPETAHTLNAHLTQCPECRTQVESWRRALKRLDAWEIPARGRTGLLSQPLVAWAAAAAIVLGIGFGLGRLAPASPDPKKMARLEASIQATLTAQNNALASLEARINAAQRAESAQLATEVASLLEAKQDEDRAVYMALRKDLETVATVADEQLQDTQLKLFELASGSKPAE